MPPKRKRGALEPFDPNKSDSEDENFDPRVDQPKKSKKRTKPSRQARRGTSRSKNRYAGSDVEDDDISNSEDADSIVAESGDEEMDDEDDGGGHITAFGRRARKAAVKPKTYKESTEEEGDDDDDNNNNNNSNNNDTDDDGDSHRGANGSDQDSPRKARSTHLATPPPPRSRRKIVTIKFTPGSAVTGLTRRSTRARTQDPEDLVELSTSGNHAQPARSAKSRSPEMLARTRSSRATKSVKRAPEPIAEATQESTVIETPTGQDSDELAADPIPADASPDKAVDASTLR